ncbi:MAG: calcium-translocating P-type ATPase, PMCA-type [Candidatus Aenigmarchaeota archaeon]|nr:calcium-translocating P-type ATPase, PMCA-type [Candidatus Aenigmarchaeota archaeon]
MGRKTQKSEEILGNNQEPWHSIDIDVVLHRLGTNEKKGLTESEAERRLEKYGPNALAEEKERFKVLKLIIDQFKDYFIIMLLIATVISFFLGEIVDAITIAIIVILCAVIGIIQNYRAEKALEALKKLTASTARVLRDGKEITIPSEEVVPGDIIFLEAGDRVSADARLIMNASLRLDEAPLTGESTPVEKKLSTLDINTPVADRKNSVFMGTHIVFGRGLAVVTETGMSTEFGKIAGAVQAIKQEKTPLEVKLDSFAKKVGLVIIGVCVVIFILDTIEFGTAPKVLVRSFMTAVALAVSAVPEGLPALVIITLALGARELAKRNSLIRRLASAETLGSTTFICADKTGTLTKGKMTVRKVYTNFKMINVTERGFEGKDSNLETLLRIGVLCNNVVVGDKGVTGDPTEVALFHSANKFGMKKDELEKKFPRIGEIPFSSERKRMTTIHKVKNKKIAYVKGAPEIILDRCTHVLKNNRVKKLTEEERRNILRANEKMAQDALRVLGMAYRELPRTEKEFTENIEKRLIFVGLQGMIDPPRPEAIKAVKITRKAGIKNVMITGDHKLTAMAIAREMDIYRKGDMALTGEELDKLSDEEFYETVEKVTVYARVSPMHKLRIVETLQKKGEHIVAMTGDGVNDAPALKKADIGVAMGITGTDVSKEASDMVLVDDNYATMVTALEGGRHIYDNIRKYIRFLMSCNFDELVVIGTFAILGYPLPYLPVQLLWINLITDGPPAMALAVDPAEKEIMKRKPRDPKKGIFHGMLAFMLVSFVCQSLGSLTLFSVGYHLYNDADVARTMNFIQSALFELFVIWNCRSETRSVWRMGKDAFRNKFFVLAVLSGIALTIGLPYIPVLAGAFHVVPLTLTQWAMTIGIASIGLFVVLPELWMGRKIFGHQ